MRATRRRIDVTGVSGGRVSAVQAHRSFREVVGQSAAEFTLQLLQAPSVEQGSSALRREPGVYTPEELFSESAARGPLLERLLSVPGTLNYGFDMSPNPVSSSVTVE